MKKIKNYNQHINEMLFKTLYLNNPLSDIFKKSVKNIFELTLNINDLECDTTFYDMYKKYNISIYHNSMYNKIFKEKIETYLSKIFISNNFSCYRYKIKINLYNNDSQESIFSIYFIGTKNELTKIANYYGLDSINIKNLFGPNMKLSKYIEHSPGLKKRKHIKTHLQK